MQYGNAAFSRCQVFRLASRKLFSDALCGGDTNQQNDVVPKVRRAARVSLDAGNQTVHHRCRDLRGGQSLCFRIFTAAREQCGKPLDLQKLLAAWANLGHAVGEKGRECPSVQG